MKRWRAAACAVVVGVVAMVSVGGASLARSPAERRVAERPISVIGQQVARADVVSEVAAIEPAAPEPVPPAPSVSEAIAPPPAAFVIVPGAIVGRPASSPGRVLPEGSGGTWALVVGINDYPGDDHDLRFAVNDANDVDDALAGVGVPVERRLVLRDGRATAAAIAAGVDWLVDHAGPDAVAVVSFAGHAREHGRGSQSFVAADGVELSDRDLAAQLEPLRARATWLNFATCYAGGFDELLAEGRTLVAAAPAGKLAYENTAIGRSYLGEYMVRRALRSTADGDVRSSFVTAREAIRRDYPDRVPVELTSSPGLVVRLRPPAAGSAAAAPDSPGAAPPPRPSAGPPAAEPDSCASITLGVVECS